MPADPHRVVLLRRVGALDGPARATAFLDLRAGFGRGRMHGLKQEDDGWTGRSGALRFRWTGAGRARPADGALTLAVELAAGHAYAVLRGLTSASGAMVAAATTSLPERLEAGRNYD